MKKHILIISAIAALLCGFLACAGTASGENGEGEEKKEIVVDLTGGYRHFDPVMEFSWFMPEWVDCPTFPDLDGDGTLDVCFTQYTVRSFGMSEELVAVPLAGGSINGSVTLQGTADAPFSSITFRLNNSIVQSEYAIQVEGGRAVIEYFDETGSLQEKEISSAAPGTVVRIKAFPQKGKYVNEWKSDGISISGPRDDKYGEYPVLGRFVMPAHNVTVKPVSKEQKPYTVELERGTIESGLKDYNIGAVIGFYETFGEDLIDLDGDGTIDIEYSGWKSTMAFSAPALHSTGKEYEISELNDGPNWPIIIRYPEDAFTIDLSEGVVAGSWDNEAAIKALRNNLKPFELADRAGVYDVDGDGQADLRIAPDDSMLSVLYSCSISDTFEIPASEDGINHSVTLLFRKKPEYHTVTVNVSEGGNAKVYEQETWSNAFRIEYPGVERLIGKENSLVGGNSERIQIKNAYENVTAPFVASTENVYLKGTAVYLHIWPEEGYQVKSVIVNGTEMGPEVAKCVLFMVKDLEIEVSFEKAPEPTPTPTDTPTPTPTDEPSPTPTAEVTSEPTEAPTKDRENPRGENKGDSFNPLYLIPVAAALCAALAAGVIWWRKKKKAAKAGGKEPAVEGPIDTMTDASADTVADSPVESAENDKE
ncbi:MAG: hypothetical protein K6F26_00450 [Lachnospiraceae bacterium]|nr:hypothetical protein [Lachnospiraceae bacterium]